MTIDVRTDVRPGDLGRVIAMQGRLYAKEYGYDLRFEAYVAETLAEFGRRQPGRVRDRLWLAETDERLVGTIGIVEREDNLAQLRWFLVAPEVRGTGLGHRLLDLALGFCRASGFDRVYLWTVTGLPAAAHLYLAAGFTVTEQQPPARLWGPELSEQRYDLPLR